MAAICPVCHRPAPQCICGRPPVAPLPQEEPPGILGGCLKRLAMLHLLLAAVLALTAASCDDTVSPRGPAPETSVTPEREPEEDEPGFDCRLHGNRTCYPQETRAVQR